VDAALLGVSSELNNDLLYESIVLANRAYRAGEAIGNLAVLGFQNIEDYSVVPGEHTIGHFIGWKDILDSNGETVRIYVINCRGTKIDSVEEWASNFTLASLNGYHYGFHEATKEVRKHFLDYVKKYGADDEKPEQCKVWIMGHSRGAAVANILGGAFLVEDGYSRSNVFTYTFACPNAVKGTAPAVNNVFNYNIGGDLVPNVPVEQWNFSRYGITVTRKNGEKDFGEHLTDYKTMESLVERIGEVTFSKVLELYLNVTIEEEGLNDAAEVFTLYLSTISELLVSALPDIPEVVKDIGPTHDSRTYIKWIASITGR